MSGLLIFGISVVFIGAGLWAFDSKKIVDRLWGLTAIIVGVVWLHVALDATHQASMHQASMHQDATHQASMHQDATHQDATHPDSMHRPVKKEASNMETHELLVVLAVIQRYDHKWFIRHDADYAELRFEVFKMDHSDYVILQHTGMYEEKTSTSAHAIFSQTVEDVFDE